MTHDDALRKALACLRLSKSANEHEAALAAARAQEIITRYNLNIDGIDLNEPDKARSEDNEPIVDFGNDPIDTMRRRWGLNLASALSRQNQCRVYYTTDHKGDTVIKVMGHPSDVQTVRYLYNYFRAEVIRLRKERCIGYSETFQRQFELGVVDAIRMKLKEQQEKTFADARNSHTASPTALMRVNTAITRLEKRGLDVEQFMANKFPNMRKSSGRGSVVETGGRWAGQQAGKDIRMTRAGAALGSGRKAIE